MHLFQVVSFYPTVPACTSNDAAERIGATLGQIDKLYNL